MCTKTIIIYKISLYANVAFVTVVSIGVVIGDRTAGNAVSPWYGEHMKFDILA